MVFIMREGPPFSHVFIFEKRPLVGRSTNFILIKLFS